MTTPDGRSPELHDNLSPDDADRLGPNDPNVAANRDTDDPVDHEQLIGEPVDDDDPVLDAERAAVEHESTEEAGTEPAAEPTTGPDRTGR